MCPHLLQSPNLMIQFSVSYFPVTLLLGHSSGCPFSIIHSHKYLLFNFFRLTSLNNSLIIGLINYWVLCQIIVSLLIFEVNDVCFSSQIPPQIFLGWQDYPPSLFFLALWKYKNAYWFCSENNLVLKIKTCNRNSKKTNNSFSWSTNNYAYSQHCSSPSIAMYLIFLYWRTESSSPA